MSDTRTLLTIALATIVGNGSGWQSLANLDPSVAWRAELASAAAATDQVEVWVSSDNGGPSNYVGSTPPSGSKLVTLQGKNASITIEPSAGPALYVNLVRAVGTTALNALVTGGLATSGTGPAPGTYWANGGNAAGPLTGGTLDGSATTVGGLSAASATTITTGTTGALVVDSGTTGDVNLGTGAGGVDANAKTVRLATGAAVKTLVMGSATGASSAQLLAGSGGMGINAGPPGLAGLAIDTGAGGSGILTIGNANAQTVDIGNGSTTTTITVAVAGGGSVNIDTQADAASTNISTGAGAKTVTVGSVNTTSTTTIRCGTGGLGLGVAAPGASGVSLDTPAAGALLVGQNNATSCAIGGIGGALATASMQTTAGGTVNINTGNVATTTNVGTAGAAASTVNVGSSVTTSATTVRCGTGGLGLGVAAPGGTGVSIDTPAVGSILIGGVNSTFVQVGNATGATSVRVNTGTGGFGVNVTPNASAMVDFNGTTTQGVRFPNLTTTQKNAIAAPAAGLVVFDTTLAKLCVYSGAGWQTITSV